MDATTIVFVAAGIVLVVGQLLRRTGRRYVGGAGGAGSDAGTVATLLSTVFHLVTLGVTALVAAVPVGEGVSGFLVRFDPSVPGHSPSYLPPSGLPGSSDGTCTRG